MQFSSSSSRTGCGRSGSGCVPTLDYLDFVNIKFVKISIGCGCLAGQIIQVRRELILNELFLRILSETIGMPNFT
jgi:hypothetical protein